MRPIRTAAAIAAPFESLGTLLSSHRAVTRVSLAALSFTIVIAFSQQASTQAGPEPAPLVPESLLPQNIGIAVETDESVAVSFETAMDPASVEAAIQILPEQGFELSWNDGGTRLTIEPERLWRTDERYLVIVADSSRTAGGASLQGALRYSFTTETAPMVSDFQVRFTSADLPAAETEAPLAEAPGAEAEIDRDASADLGATASHPTAKDVSASSSISISFSEEMDQADVEQNFAISPEAAGNLTWDEGNLVFTPAGRLEPGARYTVSLIGAHDRAGNVLGGKGNFSFIVQAGAQLVRTEPALDASDVEPEAVVMWFSQPMEVDATNEAFTLTDTSSGALVGGHLNWNDAQTQLTFSPDSTFAAGRTFEVALSKDARDVDGNSVSTEWSFATKAAPVIVPAAAPEPSRSAATTRSAPASAPPAAPATSLAGYALNQVNAARAAYGFAPLVLDAGISAVASAHAMDQASNGYFSHYGQNGSTRESRLAAGGVSFSWSGENQCYHVGMSQQATLDWCHAQFMAEPYPGHWNHIGNILNPKAKRMGVGIATVGGRTVITWNFTD